jgi:PAS domain S-box-containing protein
LGAQELKILATTDHITAATVFRRLWLHLPAGGSLPEDVWNSRHRFLLGLTWFHALVIAFVGPIIGYSWDLSLRAPFRDGTVLHTVAEGSIIAAFAVLASWSRWSRAVRASLVGFGLISSSAILVHLSGGYIELHFHFFVMLVFLALYQDWVPYSLAVLYVAVHHGVVGVLDPRDVYNHPAAINAPWKWAGIHAFFVLFSCVGSIIAWRFNEKAHAQTKSVLDSAGEGIFGLDADGNVTFLNPAAARMLGLDERQITGKQIQEITKHAKADGTLFDDRSSPILSTLKDGSGHQGSEEIFCRSDGMTFPVDYVSTPIFERGELTGAVVSFRDVTQSREREKALRESEERFRQIAENIEDVFWVTNPTTNGWIYISPAYKKIWGQNPDISRSAAHAWLGSIHADDLGHVLHALVTKQIQGTYDEQYRIIRPDGSIRWIRERAYPIRDDFGKVYRVTGIAADITERRQAEDQIQKLNQELERRVLQRTAQLETANKELEAFSYSVSHDLRAPLRSIDGFSQALLRGNADQLDEKGKHYLTRVRGATQRMEQLIDDLLNLSRVTRGEMRREQVDLGMIAKTVAAELKHVFPERPVDFFIAPDLLTEGDTRLLRVLLENLLQNAWKFTSKHSQAKIELGATELDGRKTFYVRDDGAGFDMNYADKLFAPFQRMHSQKEFEGTGIGLATVQRIIQRHGGRVWAEGAVDQGATFYFQL